jgi:hypothetical protein
MVEPDVGRHGLAILLVLFVILGVEDVLVWLNSGTVPGIEFFLAALLVVAIAAAAIRESSRHAPLGR